VRAPRAWLVALVLVGACDFEAARQRYTADYCSRVCLASPSEPDCAECGAPDAGPGDAGAGDAGGLDGGGPDAGGTDAGDADAGPVDGGADAGTADHVAITVDGGLVGACLVVALQPVDAMGAPKPVAGGPVNVQLNCTPPQSFSADATCTGSPGTSVSVGGASAAFASFTPLAVKHLDCLTAATGLRPTAFSIEARAQLRVELLDGGAAPDQTVCEAMQVRATDALGASIPLPAAGAVTLDAEGGLVGRASDCSDLDAGLSLTLPASPAPQVFYVKTPVGSSDGGVLVFHVRPDAGVLAEESRVTFPITCRPQGASCGGFTGSCCNGCNVLASNTCR
jgi:hypothetical protein